MKELNTLAIIPARGGSKRIPKKNIKKFLGKPIINYSIEAAIKSRIFNEIMVSTDDKKIAMVAIKAGAKVPFLRSKKNSNDKSIIAEVIKEVLINYKQNKKTNFKYACCIFSTAPLIKPKIIKKGLDILIKKKCDTVISVTKYEFPIQRSLIIENGVLKFKWPRNYNKRSQDLLPHYHDAGQFIWVRCSSFLKNNQFFSKKTMPIILPNKYVQDIDTNEDWQSAEIKYKLLFKKHEI